MFPGHRTDRVRNTRLLWANSPRDILRMACAYLLRGFFAPSVTELRGPRTLRWEDATFGAIRIDEGNGLDLDRQDFFHPLRFCGFSLPLAGHIAELIFGADTSTQRFAFEYQERCYLLHFVCGKGG